MSNDILQGWKDIASYLGCDVRTARRWERDRHLPVRRLPGEGRANVYALIPELEKWRKSASEPEELPMPVAEQPEPAAESVATVPVMPPTPAMPPQAVVPEAVAQPVAMSRSRFANAKWRVAAGVAVVVLLSAGWMTRSLWYRSGPAALHAEVNPLPSNVPYSSSVAGVTDLTLRGTFFYERRKPNDLDMAQRALTTATERDPDYAPAWSALATTLILQREFGDDTNADPIPQAEAAAQRAINLDPNLARAHAALAYVLFFYRWNSADAEDQYRKAIRLNPQDALPHHSYAAMLTFEKRFPEALAQLDIAQRLDPASTSILASRYFVFGHMGHRDEALAELREFAKTDAADTAVIGRTGALCGMPPADLPCVLDSTIRVSQMDGRNHARDAAVRLRDVLQTSGPAAMWQQQLQQARTPLERAIVEMQLGHSDRALEDLNAALQAHLPSLIGIRIDPTFDPLHSDPRFQRIEAAIGLPTTP